VWDELGLAGTNRRCFCRYDADLEMIWLEPAAARGQHWQFRSIFRQGYNAGEFLQDSCQPAIGTSAIQFSVKGARQKQVQLGYIWQDCTRPEKEKTFQE
jgi:hypothetical protein